MTRLLLLLLCIGCGRAAEPLPLDLGGIDARDVADCARNACGDCAPPPVEECNGRDDDCDGLVDEGCSLLWLSGVAPPLRLRGGAAVALQSPGWSTPYGSAAIYEDRVVYAPAPNAAPEVLAATDLTDAGLANASDHDPDFDGSQIVWRHSHTYFDDQNDNSTLMAMTLAERKPRELFTGVGLGAPSLSEGRVALAATLAAPGTAPTTSHLLLIDLATGDKTDLTLAGVVESAPALDGDWLAYERRDALDGDAQVRALHLPDHVLAAPSDGLDGSCMTPALDGTQVVFMRLPPQAPSEIWWYDLATGARKKLGTGVRPRIASGLVCWDGSDGVQVADPARGRSLRVATAGAFCALDGRRVAWLGHQGLTYRDLGEDEP
jgi:hypothetical protein